MAGKVEMRREALRETLIEISERLIARDGIGAIKARDLAAEAGCAVGAIYNVFADLNDIVIAVNGRTFAALGHRVAASVEGQEALAPAQRLIRMSFAYLQYATDHPRLWRCLFDLQMSSDMDVPEWYLKELGRLFAYISAPLGQVFPNKSESEIDLLTRTLFSSVHGIVLLGLENRISGVPRERLEAMITLILQTVVKAD